MSVEFRCPSCRALFPGTDAQVGRDVTCPACNYWHSAQNATAVQQYRQSLPGEQLQEGDQFGDRYVIHRILGAGGMGDVYLATDTVFGREVAVKVLQGRFAPGTAIVHRFYDEARITGQLQHPGIPPVHDLGTLPDGRPYLAMKLIQGKTLDDLLFSRADVKSELARFLGIFSQVCQAVAYAHAHGVVHRDLKPSNVMVGAFGEVQVMDWGLAKVLADTRPTAKNVAVESNFPGTKPLVAPTIRSGRSGDLRTTAGAVLGTPAYMPPEQALGQHESVGRASDVFGLGGILAKILTGRPPYVGRTAAETLGQAIAGDVKEVLEATEAVADPELASLVSECLKPDPAMRKQDAAWVVEEMSRYFAKVAEQERTAEVQRVRTEVAGEVRVAEEYKRRDELMAETSATMRLIDQHRREAGEKAVHSVNAHWAGVVNDLNGRLRKAEDALRHKQIVPSQIHESGDVHLNKSDRANQTVSSGDIKIVFLNLAILATFLAAALAHYIIR